MKRRVVSISVALVALVCLGVILGWPVAEWLEARECWLAADARVDAVYVLAGRPSLVRSKGVVAWLQGGGHTARVLVAADPMKGGWSRADQRNLTMGEWALRQLSESLAETGLDIEVEVIELDMGGTDAEIASLARLVNQREDIRSVGLATSRFHIRRTRKCAREHFDEVPDMIPAVETWRDRSPWVVGIEVLKMLRDRMGLTRVISRGLWQREKGSGTLNIEQGTPNGEREKI